MKILNTFFSQKILQIQENKRIFSALASGFAGILSKASSLLLQIISIPLLTDYLGKEQFGGLLTFLSLTLFLGVSDLGIGINLQNKLAHLEASNQNDETSKLLSTSFLIMSFFCLFIIFIFCGIFYFIDFNLFFLSQKINENNLVGPIITICFCLTMPFLIINKAYSAKFKGYVFEIFSSISFLLVIFFLWCAVHFHWSINVIALIYQGVPLILSISSFIYFFRLNKELSFTIRRINYIFLKNTVSESLKYLLVPFSVMLIIAPDSLLVAKFIGVKEVTTYNILLRLTYFFTFPILLFINSFLSSFNDAFIRNDFAWAKKNITRMLLTISFLAALYSVIIFFWGDNIIQLWVSGIHIDSKTWASIIIYNTYLLFNSFFSLLALTTMFNDILIRTYFIAALVTFTCKILILAIFPQLSVLFFVPAFIMSVLFFIPITKKINERIYVY